MSTVTTTVMTTITRSATSRMRKGIDCKLLRGAAQTKMHAIQLLITDTKPHTDNYQWRHQLWDITWDTEARAPSTFNNVILVHFGVNLRANYPSIV